MIQINYHQISRPKSDLSDIQPIMTEVEGMYLDITIQMQKINPDSIVMEALKKFKKELSKALIDIYTQVNEMHRIKNNNKVLNLRR